MFKSLHYLSLLVSLVHGSGVQILHPGQLVYDLGEDGNINSQMANFGHLIYGTQTMGKLHFPAANVQGCEKFDLSHFANDPLFDTDDDMKPIIMVDRGTCSNTQKVLNAQNAGALAVIIADDRVESVIGLNLGDDGVGSQINVPSFMIKKWDADKIKDSLDQGEAVYVKAHVDMYHPDNIVEYELWYASIIDLIEDDIFRIGVYQKIFGDQGLTEFTPRIYTFKGDILPKEIREENCLSDGKYCASFPADPAVQFPDKWSPVDILYENLREKCIFQLELEEGRSEASNRYFDYLINFSKSCLSHSNLAKCSKAILNFWGGPTYQKVQECVTNSFEEPGNQQSDNRILKEDAAFQSLHGIQIHPQIIINNQTYTGEWTGEDISKAVCAGFRDPPSGCMESVGEFSYGSEEDEFEIITINRGWHLWAVLAAGIICNLLLLYGYRRKTKREMSEQMSAQVNQAVSQYFALRDQSTSSI